MKRFVSLFVIITFLATCSAFAISKNEPLKKLSAGLDNMAYGTIECPDNVNETNSKGQKAFATCTDATKDDVGRAIARVVGGIWQVATFWYPES